MTMAVGMICTRITPNRSFRTEALISSRSGREMLHNPHWPMDAAQKLGVDAPFSGIPMRTRISSISA